MVHAVRRLDYMNIQQVPGESVKLMNALYCLYAQ